MTDMNHMFYMAQLFNGDISNVSVGVSAAVSVGVKGSVYVVMRVNVRAVRVRVKVVKARAGVSVRLQHVLYGAAF